jgi:hypothetical protein
VDQAKYEQPEEMHRQAHPDTLTNMTILASAYWSQTRWAEAEGPKVRLVEGRKVIFGHRNLDTLMAMANLAHTWKSQGRNQEAIGLTT